MNLQNILIFLFVIGYSLIGCSEMESSREGYLKVEPKIVIELPGILNESSGLVRNPNGLLIGHNDSGDRPVLYEFNPVNGLRNRTIVIEEASHKDWEDLADDETHIYIGDIGNNLGNRKDLTIYKVSRDSVFLNDTVVAESITFTYPEQSVFKIRNNHNFDCEAIITKGDSLYLFTKNRGDFKTNVYTLPTAPGNYEAKKIESYDVGGLLTAADYDENLKMFALVGYGGYDGRFSPFIWVTPEIDSTSFFNDRSFRLDLTIYAQTEALLIRPPGILQITNEEESFTEIGYLYELDLTPFMTDSIK